MFCEFCGAKLGLHKCLLDPQFREFIYLYIYNMFLLESKFNKNYKIMPTEQEFDNWANENGFLTSKQIKETYKNEEYQDLILLAILDYEEFDPLLMTFYTSSDYEQAIDIEYNTYSEFRSHRLEKLFKGQELTIEDITSRTGLNFYETNEGINTWQL